MGDTKIEWTNKAWNPVRGCSVVSEGCRNCYAMSFAARFAGEGMPYEGLAYRNESGAHWTGKVKLVEEHLDDPLRWKKPCRIFVNSMSDLFHESLTEIEIGQVFSVMAQCPQHTFQVLTKRPQIMLETLRMARDVFDFDEPLPNVWLGVSVEDQKTADERIPLLLQTPAAVRWISAEPLLGPVDLRFLKPHEINRGTQHGFDALAGSDATRRNGRHELWGRDVKGNEREGERIDWLVVGGESGPKARPMHPDWARSLRDQCVAAGVPFFFKQWGAFMEDQSKMYRGNPSEGNFNTGPQNGVLWVSNLGSVRCTPPSSLIPGKTSTTMIRVGKKAAGRLLDGREWNEFPEAKAVTVCR